MRAIKWFAALGVAGALVVQSTGAAAVNKVVRIAGVDRYGTSQQINSHYGGGDNGFAVAVVASGENFPDALSAGAAAVKLQGPLLIVGRTYGIWPGDELDRLAPRRLILVGGSAALTSDLLQGIQRWAADNRAVLDVVAGSDRYETAAMVSATAFPAQTDTVFVVTGQDFPDALGAVPAAGTTPGKSPVLLVTRDDIPQSVRAELSRLSPRRIVVLGGSSVVSDAVVAALDEFATDPVVRVAGNDRYGTSVEVSKHFFQTMPPIPVAFLVNGFRFADALAAGAYASGQGPILLSERDCIPPDVLAEVARVGSSFAYLVGGPAVLTDRVEQLLKCG